MIKGCLKRVVRVCLTKKNNALYLILFVTLMFIKATSLKFINSLKAV